MQLRSITVQLMTIAVAAGAAAPAFADIAVESDRTEIVAEAGNRNGVLEPGESFALTHWLHSLEFTPLTGVSGVLTGGPELSFSAATAAFGDLLFGQPTSNVTPFAGSVDGAAECGAPLEMQLALTSSGGSATVPVTIHTGAAGPSTPWESADVPRTLLDPGTVSSVLPVTAAGRVSAVRVHIGELRHTYTGDLRLVLVAPDGRGVLLANRLGDAGDHYLGTVFDGTAGTGIAGARAPFTGTFRPQGDLGMLTGMPAAGEWQLRVTDAMSGDRGVLVSWGLDLAVAVCEPVNTGEPPGFARRSERAQGQWPDPPGWSRHDHERRSR